ncbi:MAG: DUF4160 domain-containing protein [Candidatus Aminicenantes bacterium]|nr:DUF4160 domain-containing protein [Candidatus Aminicenantes bacterium]
MRGEYNGVFHLKTLEMTEGDLPSRAVRLINEWQEEYQNELVKMWETKEFKKLPGLK